MYDVFIMDMGGHDFNVQALLKRFPHAQVLRYYDTHLNTLKRAVARAKTPFCWVISSCCDYSGFNFSYKASPWEAYQMHCWASGAEKFGDTFLINVAEFKKQQDIELLEWYKDINWHTDGVERISWPVLLTESEDITGTIKSYKFTAPYVWVNSEYPIDVPLWNKRAWYVASRSGEISLVPRDAQAYLKTQAYDYPYIIRLSDDTWMDTPMDVIFISNGEPMAQDNWEHLKKMCPRAKHSYGITGREAAYKAAAQLSETPWFFAVFAKTEVLPTFDFSFRPDMLQAPKHYIFHSRNPLNGLEYGAMNINLYNKQLVLDTKPGLDFTLSALHTVVPICASVSRFNTDPWITWRSAFREVLKLKLEVELENRPEIAYRLKTWCTTAVGENAEFCLTGAHDALKYYDDVCGDYEKLKLSFDWAWLQEYYYTLYNQRPWEFKND